MFIKIVSQSEHSGKLGKREEVLTKNLNENNEHYEQLKGRNKKLSRLNKYVSKSSRTRAFCDRCCGERRQQQQQQQIQQPQIQQQQNQPSTVALYRSYTDSVSDLSSNRFVSAEQEVSSDKDADADGDADADADANGDAGDAGADDEVDVSSLLVPFIEIEQREPKAAAATNTRTKEADKGLRAATSYADAIASSIISRSHTTRAVSPPVICCFSSIREKTGRHLRPDEQLLPATESDRCCHNEAKAFRSYLRCVRCVRYPTSFPPHAKCRYCLELTEGNKNQVSVPAHRLEPHQAQQFNSSCLSAINKSLLSSASSQNSEHESGTCHDSNIANDNNGNNCDIAPVSVENCRSTAFEENNNDNYNCKLNILDSGSLESKTTCLLRYDCNGYLKQEIALSNRSEEVEEESATETGVSIAETLNSVASTKCNALKDCNIVADLIKSLGIGRLSQTEFSTLNVPGLYIDLTIPSENAVAASSSNVSSNSDFSRISVHNLTSCSNYVVDYRIRQQGISATALQYKQLPVIQTFRSLVGNGEETENKMEKRRNTLDRFQRLTFGRKSSPSNSVEVASNSKADKHRKTFERSERLKELTELLRGSNMSRSSSTPTPPPVPPPRRPRAPNSSSGASSLDVQDAAATCVDDHQCQPPTEELKLPAGAAASAQLVKQNSTNSKTTNNNSNSNSNSSGNTSSSTTSRLFHSIRPNASFSNLEAFVLGNREKSKSSPPLAARDEVDPTSSEWATQLSRPESRTEQSSPSAAQKGRLPFRSLSFTQIDCKSTLSAWRDRLRQKAIEPPTLTHKRPEHFTDLPHKHVGGRESETAAAATAAAAGGEREENADPGWVHIPLKSTGLSINLNYGQEKSLENVLEDVSESIADDDIFNTDNSIGASVVPATASSVIAAHAKMESLSDTIHSEGECNANEEFVLPVIVKTSNPPIIVEPECTETKSETLSSPNLVTLLEETTTSLEETVEDVAMSAADNFLQTATTCLIPIPVFECAAQEWVETPAQEWVEVSPEFGIVPETMQPPMSHAACQISQTKMLTTAICGDSLPIISVSRSLEEENDDYESELASPQTESKSNRYPVDEPQSGQQYQDQDDISTELRSSSKMATPRHSTGERHKRHLERSTKRKGMYIDNSDWQQRVDTRGLALDISLGNFENAKPDSPDDPKVYANSPIMFDLNTPELEKSSLSWSGSLDKPPLLSSFSCQSSEEKDDASTSNNNNNNNNSGSNSKSNSFLRTDSLSDTEERASWSPTPSGDYDKRYSKRPLTVRGPYGQMLEAELKSRPNRMHFEEIMEEMRDANADSPHTRREHTSKSNAGSTRNLPQYSNSVRVRKSNAYLPVPSHTRAASTPSQIEHVSKGSPMPVSVSAKDLNKVTSAGDKHLKRASSEVPISKPAHNKRSQSISTDSKSQHLHQHHQHHHHHGKRSPDGSRTGGNSSNKSDVAPTAALLAELLKGSSENMLSEQRQKTIADTRSYVVQEIYRNEQSYVESLQTVVVKYLKVLKSPEHAGMIDTRTVDEIFFMVPDILEIHEKFLVELKHRLDDWDVQQKVGDAFIETFSKLEVLEVYTSFVNNCNRAKNAIRSMKHQRPSFAKFLETTAREHKGKLTLDNLLIKPVQKFPNYELLFARLIKHTDHDHPDQKHLQDVIKLVHDILVHINCKEREIMENGQREATLRELETVIEGMTDLIAPERQFLLFDLVSMPSGQGARKDRGFFLFNDLLVLTSIKKRSGTIRKPNSSTCPGSVATTLDTNKYKFLTKISLDCLEIVKSKDDNIKRIVSEIENLAEDCNKLQQITDITTSLKYPHQYLEDVVRELHRDIQRQLAERQSNDTQLNMLELTVSSPNGSQKLTVVFSKTEKRTNWEETFVEAKQKLAATLERHPIPEFLTSIPIRKTRAGLQFTCAAATLSEKRDVWVCNSDGYVGQVCIMSLHPEPNVTSCNGVCNARILCVASVPAYSSSATEENSASKRKEEKAQGVGSYTQKLRDYRKSISPSAQPASELTPSALATPEKKKHSATLPVVGNGPDAASNSDTQLDLNLSSSDDEPDVAVAATLEQRMPSPAPSLHTTYHMQQDSNPEESECNQSTMWIGTEDGCIHVYNSTDNIRIKKNRIKIEHHSAVFSILYLDNRVFVSLANGDICVYLRDGATSWNTCLSHCLSIGTVTSPVTKLLNVNGKLWCSIQGIIKVLDTESFSVVNQIQISSDSKPITNMTVANNHVWISIQNSAHIKCFHCNTHQLVTEVNLAPAVNKMLSNCDEIIRQHKAACLRVTSLLCCKDLIWIGTSAGVLLTIPTQSYEKGAHNIVPTGIPHGHTGHVRFLTFVETPSPGVEAGAQMAANASGRDAGSGTSDEYTKQGSTKNSKTKSETKNILIISGGDGYEDFRNSGANSLSEIAGREDSTNHLLIWQI